MNETLAITDNWFICYNEVSDHLEILEWVSLENMPINDKIQMMNFIKESLLSCNGKTIYDSLRHDTSYSIYSKLNKRGYFKSSSERILIDNSALEYIRNLLNKYNSTEELLNDEIILKNKEYYNYILHELYFEVDDSFYDTYQKKLN